MRPTMNKITKALLALGVAFMMHSAAWAGPEAALLGDWNVKLNYQGNLIPAKITFTQEGGALKGTWSSERGDSPLTNIAFDGAKLTFNRKIKFQDQEFELQYEGKVEGGKLTGKFTTPMGDMESNGDRVGGAAPVAAAEAAPAAGGAANPVGKWRVGVNGAELLGGELEIVEKDGKLSGSFSTQLGEQTIDEVSIDGKNVHFKTTVDAGGFNVPLHFKGTIEGDQVVGMLGLSVEGKRLGAPKAVAAAAAAPAPAGGSSNTGKWKLSIQSPDGAQYDGDFEVKEEGGKLTGILTTELGQVKIPEIKRDGQNVAFATEIDFGGVMVPISFKGTDDGSKLKGAVTLNMQGQELELPVEGAKEGAVAAAPAAAPAGGFTANGKWKLAIQSPDGAQYDGDFDVKEEGGKLGGVLTTELGEVKIANITVNGSEVAFSTEVDFGGVMVPLKFKGNGEGDKLKGAVTLNMEGQEMELPVEGTREGGAPAAATTAAAPAGGFSANGKWKLSIQSPDGAQYDGDFVVAESGGKIGGTLTTELGEVKIAEITVNGSEVAFSTEVDFGGVMVPLKFKGTGSGDDLKGAVTLNMEGQEMELPVEGKREGGAAAPSGFNAHGKWKLSIQSPDGAQYDGDFVVAESGGKIGGTLTTELGEVKIAEITVNGSEVAFSTEVDFGGVMVPLKFKGTGNGDDLKGAVTLNMEGQEMELPVEGKREGAAAAPAGAAPAAVAGVWDLEVQTPDGATSLADLTITEKNGSFSAVLNTELGQGKIDGVKLEGNGISFSAKGDFGGVQVPIEFKGTLSGETLEGTAKLQFEGQDMELPIKGKKSAKSADAAKSGDKKTAEAAPCCKTGGACCPGGPCCKAA